MSDAKTYRFGFACGGALALCLAACSPNSDATSDEAAPDTSVASEVEMPFTINPENWPQQPTVFTRDPEMERKIADLLSRMTLEEKVGQIIQADIASVTPDEVREYNLGSILNGGNSAPGNDVRVEAQAWLDLADEFWVASTDTSDGGVGIPAMWGTDAVHGHNNIVGATVFPHNIGLGATHNPSLLNKIGEVTAREMLATGVDWTFAPTIAIARDDRWGRTYESYSENPELVADYAVELVKGIQGTLNYETFLDDNHMVATVKHFVGDGGTVDGTDQGDNQYTEADLRDLQAAGYPPAIQNGAQVVMASFNSFHGRKLHGHKELLTDVLVGRMAFDGFVVGDWNGHGQIDGCTSVSCPDAINAGLDMFMAPDSWKELYANTLEQVRAGEITEERLNEAVSRILRVKMRTGLFEAGLPSERPNAGAWENFGSTEHRAVARQAVRESLVLLKNNDGVLPIAPTAKVMLAGDGADDIGKMSGGWTLSWQGTGNKNSDFPNGQSIYNSVLEAVGAAGGQAFLSEDGSYEDKPDVAIVVFGEDPYAEFQGDVEHVDFGPTDSLNLLKSLQADGIKTVSVFLSGRPMWVNPEINASDAFVAAWLPGSEGGGVADVLIAKPDGTPNHDFKGRLSFSWPKVAEGIAPNLGDPDYDPLFAYGYGLTYSEPKELEELSEEGGSDAITGQAKLALITAGNSTAQWFMVLEDRAGNQAVLDSIAQSPGADLIARSADYQAQEDTRIVSWSGPATLRVATRNEPVDLSIEANADLGIEIKYKLMGTADGKTSLGVSCGEGCDHRLDISGSLEGKSDNAWHTSNIKLKCFGDVDFSGVTSAFFIESDAGLELQIASAKLSQDVGNDQCDL